MSQLDRTCSGQQLQRGCLIRLLSSLCARAPLTAALCPPPLLSLLLSVVTCPQRCAFKHELRVDSVTDLPKNFALMKVIEQAAARSALMELGAPPCSQCDPEQPRRAATRYCTVCIEHLCDKHDQLLHSVATLENHQRLSLAQKAQQQQAASQSTRLLAQAAAPLKAQLRNCLKQLVESGASSQQLLPTLEQSQLNVIRSLVGPRFTRHAL